MEGSDWWQFIIVQIVSLQPMLRGLILCACVSHPQVGVKAGTCINEMPSGCAEINLPSIWSKENGGLRHIARENNKCSYFDTDTYFIVRIKRDALAWFAGELDICRLGTAENSSWFWKSPAFSSLSKISFIVHFLSPRRVPPRRSFSRPQASSFSWDYFTFSLSVSKWQGCQEYISLRIFNRRNFLSQICFVSVSCQG